MSDPERPPPYLGVDYGRKRVGLALGHPDTGLTLGLGALDHPGDDAGLVARLAEVVREREVAAVVLGQPLHASGAESPMSREVDRVAAALGEAVDVPVALQDERHTSAGAEASLADAGLRWWQYSKGHVDAIAAMTIVRDYMTARDPSLLLLAEEPPVPPPGADAKPSRQARRERARRKAKRKR